MRGRLSELDRERYSDPEAVEAELLDRAKEMPAEDLPFWCGVMGSTLRLQGRLEEASEILAEGLRLADLRLDHVAAGDLHQRRSVVLQFQVDLDGAFSENCKALARHIDADNEQGQARSLVDRGTILGAMGKMEWALDCFERSLAMLAPEEIRNRYSAHIAIARIKLEQENTCEATYHLNAAAQLEPDPYHLGKLMWAAGKVSANEVLLRRSVELLEQASPIDSLFASIDLVRHLLAVGQPRKAHLEAASLSRLIGRLKHDRAAQVAAAEIANLSLRGELTLAALGKVSARVSRAL
jgi:tetratricopeptide (TPR) repeat protein